MDTVDRETRSRIMRAIRGRDTKPEMIVRRFLSASGLRYQIHPKGIPGRPDIFMKGRGCAVFVHGCFWHGHEGCFRMPKGNREYWEAKIAENRERDAESARKLAEMGLRAIVVWECALKPRFRCAALERLRREIVFGERAIAEMRPHP